MLALPIDGINLQYTKLFDDEFFLAVSKSHHLSTKKTIYYKDIKNEDLLLLEDGHCLREQALELCSLVGITEKADFKATSMETLRQMVLANVGITLVPNIAKRTDDSLKYLAFKDRKAFRTIVMTWRKSSPKKACIKSICNLIRKTY